MPKVTSKLQENIAIITIDNPPVNATSNQVRQELHHCLQSLETIALDYVILCANGRTFVAGGDITEFDAPPQPPHLPDLIHQLEAFPAPIIAALHGHILGGGLEIALGCHYRLASQFAQFGFPEVNLGVIPGAGGTVRLPRLIACETAVEIITGGKPISANQAKKNWAHRCALLGQRCRICVGCKLPIYERNLKTTKATTDCTFKTQSASPHAEEFLCQSLQQTA